MLRTRRSPAAGRVLFALIIGLGAGLGTAAASETADGPAALAPGWRPPAFAVPAPGTYELPSLGPAADGVLLDTNGRPRHLHELFAGRVVLLSFIYTSCSNVNGCPLATHVLRGVQRRMLDEPDAGAQVRLVTISFDPERDRPEVLREHARYVTEEGADWDFLTAASEAALKPVLDAYGQTLRRDRDADGKPLGTISHVLRVYLIDRERRIRNIYSSSFLHADTVWSDVLTLLGQTDGHSATAAQDSGASLPRGGGDAVPRSSIVATPPLGLPPVPVPSGAGIDQQAVALGRKLFFDPRLSRNDTMSCAMCHVPEQGFTTNEMATAVGIEGKTVRRNPPTVYNVAYVERLFHDAREESLEQQIWGPLLAANEMGNPAVGFVLEKIRGLADYGGAFEAAFGGRGPTMETLGMALAAYQRTLISGNSAFDRWYFGGRQDALPAAARRGFELFRGKAACTACHSIAEQYALFTDQKLHNTGVGYRASMARPATHLTVEVAPGVFLQIERSAIEAAAEAPPSDLGRYEITGNPDDRWKYRTPGLRNVALTAPYMHDGSLRTLRDVVEFYNRGGIPNERLDPLVHPLGLEAGEVSDLVRFLESLTGDNVDAIVSDAVAAANGDPR